VSGEIEEAHRVFKRCKAGMYDSLTDLDDEEIGLLYRYYPEVLPGVDEQEVSNRGG
jgi:hypothetical protein